MAAVRERDHTRVRDYADVIHLKSLLNERIYACGADRDCNHGVFKDEATTCLGCLALRKR